MPTMEAIPAATPANAQPPPPRSAEVSVEVEAEVELEVEVVAMPGFGEVVSRVVLMAAVLRVGGGVNEGHGVPPRVPGHRGARPVRPGSRDGTVRAADGGRHTRG